MGLGGRRNPREGHHQQGEEVVVRRSRGEATCARIGAGDHGDEREWGLTWWIGWVGEGWRGVEGRNGRTGGPGIDGGRWKEGCSHRKEWARLRDLREACSPRAGDGAWGEIVWGELEVRGRGRGKG